MFLLFSAQEIVSAETSTTLVPASDDPVVQNAWFYYFSSLAQTIAAGSALLVALAIIRLQVFSNSLTAIERSIAEAFHRIAKIDDYQAKAFGSFLHDQWKEYFDAVAALCDESKERFTSEASYAESKPFLDSLVMQGRKLEKQNRKMHNYLASVFVGTIVLGGLAILILPVVRWISPGSLMVAWAVSGALFCTLVVCYIRLIFSSFKPK